MSLATIFKPLLKTQIILNLEFKSTFQEISKLRFFTNLSKK
jgi:hypothetical protein